MIGRPRLTNSAAQLDRKEVNMENSTEDKLEEGMCPHRWSVTFQVTCVGFGDTEEEAIDEARRYGLEDYIRDTDSFEVVKTVYANDEDTCDTCEEIADEMLGGTFQEEE